MSLAAGVASICSLASVGEQIAPQNTKDALQPMPFRSEHVGASRTLGIRPQPMDSLSVTGARLDLQWRQLSNVEYLTDGGNSWIHTAVFHGRPVVVKTLKPECQDVAVAINEIEGELSIHSRLNHPNIVSLLGAGLTSKGVRFFVLERLDGGTLTQMLGYETRIRDRRRRFWRRKMFSFLDVLRIGRSIAEAMAYCHELAIPGSIVLHRDLKPDNIGKFYGHVLENSG
jgi:serine/threonine protein kinase